LLLDIALLLLLWGHGTAARRSADAPQLNRWQKASPRPGAYVESASVEPWHEIMLVGEAPNWPPPRAGRRAGTLWYAVATGVAAGYKLLSAAREEKPLPLLLTATAVAAAFAIWQNEAFLYSLVLYIVQTLWGGFTTVQRIAKSLD